MGDPSVTANGMAGAAGGIGTIFSFIGNMMNASAAKTAGANTRASADFEAAQLEQNAGQATAAAQREALMERRRTAMLVSRGLAVAAAGGGATTDPTVSKLLSDIAGEGEYRSGVAIYQGEEKARQMNMAAEARRHEGASAEEMGVTKSRAYTMAGLGTLASGGASLYTKYGNGGPKKRQFGDGSSAGWTDAGSADSGGLA